MAELKLHIRVSANEDVVSEGVLLDAHDLPKMAKQFMNRLNCNLTEHLLLATRRVLDTAEDEEVKGKQVVPQVPREVSVGDPNEDIIEILKQDRQVITMELWVPSRPNAHVIFSYFLSKDELQKVMEHVGTVEEHFGPAHLDVFSIFPDILGSHELVMGMCVNGELRKEITLWSHDHEGSMSAFRFAHDLGSEDFLVSIRSKVRSLWIDTVAGVWDDEYTIHYYLQDDVGNRWISPAEEGDAELSNVMRTVPDVIAIGGPTKGAFDDMVYGALVGLLTGKDFA